MALAFLIFKPPIPPGPVMRDFEAQYAAGATYGAARSVFGRVAEFARNSPERIAAIVLQAPSVDAAARTWHQQIRRIRANSARERFAALEAISRRDYLRAGFVRCFGTFRQSLEDAIEEKLPGIEAPALVVCGGHDPVVPARWAQELVDLLPRGELFVIPEGTHSVPFTLPDVFGAAISGFIESHKNPRPKLSRTA